MHLAGTVAGLALLTVLHSPSVVADAEVVSFVRGHASGEVTGAMLALTALGGTALVVPIAVAAAVALLALRHWRGAIALAISVASAQLIVQAIKLAIARPRPEFNATVVDAGGYSFPSGHAATGVALYGMLALLAWHGARGRARVVLTALGATLAALVGLTRVYLAAHFPTDVVAGWLTGALLVLGAWAIATHVGRQPPVTSAAA